MSIIVKNSQLNTETVNALNFLIDLDIKASTAFRLSRIIKEISSIVEDKLKMEKRILDKWVEKDEDGNPKQALDNNGQVIEGAVNLTDPESFTQEMQSLMDVENEIPFEKINRYNLNLNFSKGAVDFLKKNPSFINEYIYKNIPSLWRKLKKKFTNQKKSTVKNTINRTVHFWVWYIVLTDQLVGLFYLPKRASRLIVSIKCSKAVTCIKPIGQ